VSLRRRDLRCFRAGSNPIRYNDLVFPTRIGMGGVIEKAQGEVGRNNDAGQE
jgi:hypothetical protein